MPFYHNNQLTMVGLDSEDEDKSYVPSTPVKRKRDFESTMSSMQELDSPVSVFNDTTPSDGMWTDAHMGDQYDIPLNLWPTSSFTEAYDPSHDWFLNGHRDMRDAPMESGDYDEREAQTMSGIATEADQVDQAATTEGTVDKVEEQEDRAVSSTSYTPRAASDSDESDYAERRPSKVPKLNKDGIPRKPRQPRARLLKWDDNDWKNVALGLVWACGENGIQIPFDQASQIVSESCTAGALQQALLKLRGKQISEGHQIPSLRMAWTRKNKNSTYSSSANTKTQQTAPGTNKILLPKKRPTRFASNQTLMITLKRAYKDADRYLLAVPYGPAATVVQADQTSANGTQLSTATPSYPGHLTSGQTVPMGLHVDMPMLSKHEPIYQLGWGAEHYATMSCVGPAEYQQQNDLSQSFATTFSGANVVVSTPKWAGDNTKRHRRHTTVAEFDHDFMRHLQHDGTAEVPRTPTKQNTLAATLAAARTPGKPSQVTWSLPANHRDRSDEPMSPLSPVPRRDWQYSQLLERRRGPTAAAFRQYDRNEWVPDVHGSLLEQNFDLKDDGEEPQRDAFSHYGVGSYTGENPI
ncbi:hypothetical protein BDU57DRAFT_549055 [Ampelomyces quisqualis]|uniref:Uncharacterized protein n=1 Tax=Ampelomyces quisqualis TaxID=50730 RepID=A0A6A5QL31_AMPQU|nr:hypothetical protein BDU57DRAFT_549055 [Ampelomyces quisqualis]